MFVPHDRPTVGAGRDDTKIVVRRGVFGRRSRSGKKKKKRRSLPVTEVTVMAVMTVITVLTFASED